MNQLALLVFMSFVLASFTFASATEPREENEVIKKATFGNGCFWCTEAVFQRVQGVKSVVSGYSGGHVVNPTYQEVTSGTTGHAEVIQITYDETQISYAELLEIFFRTHDPTTLNRQGADVGPQYRSIILFHDEAQRDEALSIRKALDEAGIWDDPIVTEVTQFEIFYEAEDYHQNYFNRNSGQAYCQFVIVPKLQKFKKLFEERVRESLE